MAVLSRLNERSIHVCKGSTGGRIESEVNSPVTKEIWLELVQGEILGLDGIEEMRDRGPIETRRIWLRNGGALAGQSRLSTGGNIALSAVVMSAQALNVVVLLHDRVGILLGLKSFLRRVIDVLEK